nr:hypothetical protein [Tanacetum cinerariifolium]
MSLTGAACRWLKNKPSVLITNWETLKTKSLNKYCPPTYTTNKMEEINNFQQELDESLFRAYERFKELLMKCAQHYLTVMQEVILFYNRLDVPIRQILDFKDEVNKGVKVLETEVRQEKDIEVESFKREGKSLEQEITKKQKKEEETEELKKHLQIVIDDDDDDVYTDATPLASKIPIVDYKIHTKRNRPYFNIIRADGNHMRKIQFLDQEARYEKHVFRNGKTFDRGRGQVKVVTHGISDIIRSNERLEDSINFIDGVPNGLTKRLSSHNASLSCHLLVVLARQHLLKHLRYLKDR